MRTASKIIFCEKQAFFSAATKLVGFDLECSPSETKKLNEIIQFPVRLI